MARTQVVLYQIFVVGLETLTQTVVARHEDVARDTRCGVAGLVQHLREGRVRFAERAQVAPAAVSGAIE